MDDPPPVTNTFSIRKARVVLAGRAWRSISTTGSCPTSAAGRRRFSMRTSTSGFARAAHPRRQRQDADRLRAVDRRYVTPVPERSLASSLVPNRDVGFQAQGDLANGKAYFAGGVFNGVPDGTSSSADVDTNNRKDVAGRFVGHTGGLGFQIGGSHGTEGGPAPSFKTSIGQTWFSYDRAVVRARHPQSRDAVGLLLSRPDRCVRRDSFARRRA